METQIKVVLLILCLFSSSLDSRPEEKSPIRIFGSFNGQPNNPFHSSSGTTTNQDHQGSTQNTPTTDSNSFI